MTEENYKADEFEEAEGSLAGGESKIDANEESPERSEEHYLDNETGEFEENPLDDEDPEEDVNSGTDADPENTEDSQESTGSPVIEEPQRFRVLSYDDFITKES